MKEQLIKFEGDTVTVAMMSGLTITGDVEVHRKKQMPLKLRPDDYEWPEDEWPEVVTGVFVADWLVDPYSVVAIKKED